MFKNFLIWLNSFFVKKKVGLYSTYVGNADIRNYIAEDPTTQVLLDSARLDLLKINNLEGYLKEIVQTSIKDISKKLVPNSGYDLVASERLGEMYKIGITTNLYNRLKSLKSLFKFEVSVLDTFEGTLQQVYNTEQTVLKTYNDFRIYTKKSTELFKYDILNSSLKIL